MNTVIGTTEAETVVITVYELLRGIVLGMRDRNIEQHSFLHAGSHHAAAVIDRLITTNHPEGLTLHTHVSLWVTGTSDIWSEAIRRGHKTRLLKGSYLECSTDYMKHMSWERLDKSQISQPGSRELWKELAGIFMEEFKNCKL